MAMILKTENNVWTAKNGEILVKLQVSKAVIVPDTVFLGVKSSSVNFVSKTVWNLSLENAI